jgi:hypothetical protein
MKRLAALFIALSVGGYAHAGDLTVSVRSADGKPVPDAVLMVYPNGQPTRGPIKFPWAYRVAQQNIQFSPFMLIVPVGADVQFPNLDKVRHHVYSFSPGNKFEIKLYGHEENRTAKMNAPGAVAIGCNIHDKMVSFIRVVDTAYAAKTDSNGVATVRDVPAGAITAKVWHPYLRGLKNEKALAITSVGSGAAREAVTVELRQPSGHH